MAKPFLKPNSKIYYARIKSWNAEAGVWKWSNKSTGTDDYELAESLRESFQATANAAKKLEGSTVDASHIEAVITSIYASAGIIITGSRTWPMLKDQMEKYLVSRKLRVKPATLETYRTYHNVFTSWLPDGVNLDWLDNSKASDFYEAMLDKVAVKTANERLRYVSRFYDRCMKDLGYPTNPCKTVEMAGAHTGEKLKRLPFTYDELSALVSFLQNGDGRKKEWARAVMISSMTGARLEDAVTMDSSAIKSSILTYTQKKTGKTLSIPLTVPEWARELSSIKGVICPSISEDFETSKSHNISQEFTALVQEAGIDQEYRVFKSGRKIARKTFHSIRHTLRTLIVSSGGSDAQADLILGHSGTQGKSYTHSETDAMKGVLGRVFTGD